MWCVLCAGAFGGIDLHGKERVASWTSLAETAEAEATTIYGNQSFGDAKRYC